MTNKKTIVVSLAIVLGACTVSGLILYKADRLTWFRGELANCLKLRAGNVSVEIEYPNGFISHSDEHMIRLYKDGDMEKYKASVFSTITITSNPSGGTSSVDSVAAADESVDQLIRASKEVRPGPLYDRKVAFNGHSAAFAQSTDWWGNLDYYDIPFGNQVINISVYGTSTRTQSEKIMLDKMLRSIKIIGGLDNIKDTSVENCGV